MRVLKVIRARVGDAGDVRLPDAIACYSAEGRELKRSLIAASYCGK